MGRAFSAGFLFVACLFAAAPGRAQVPAPPPAAPPATQPVTGFVSSYEITRIARSAGFDPLAPPLREGTIYVLRATDYRGILMRVVIDAHTGAIRDANRIVPGPGRYGQFYGVPSLYDPADLAEPVMVPSTADMEPPRCGRWRRIPRRALRYRTFRRCRDRVRQRWRRASRSTTAVRPRRLVRSPIRKARRRRTLRPPPSRRSIPRRSLRRRRSGRPHRARRKNLPP